MELEGTGGREGRGPMKSVNSRARKVASPPLGKRAVATVATHMGNIGLPDFQSRNTGDFCTRFRVPNGHERCSCCCSCSTYLGVIVVIRFSCP